MAVLLRRYVWKFIQRLKAGTVSVPAGVEEYEINRCFFAMAPCLPESWGTPSLEVCRFEPKNLFCCCCQGGLP